MIYAIGDIHGHLGLLKAAHDRIARDMAQNGKAPILHLGDLCDRGPDTKGVIEYLRQGIAAGENWIVLMGNHDRLFAQSLLAPDWRDPGLRSEHSWLHPRIGGAQTLESYGVHAPQDRPVAHVLADARQAVPAEHLDFLASRPDRFTHDQAWFVHAGIRPGVALQDQDQQDLVWIREPFLSHPDDHGALVVHGHTALPEAMHYGNRLNLDSSAAYGGPLTAAVIEGRKAWTVTDQGRVRL